MLKPTNHKRVAICLHGAISKIGKRFATQGELYNNNQYVNYTACYNSIIKHIVQANQNYIFDFFIHCWNPDLQGDIIKLYNPQASLFEDNNLFKDEINQKITNPIDFGGVSRSLSIKKSIELLEQHYQNSSYDVVIIYRPDVILFKNLNLDNYDTNNIYCNGNDNGDFHFIMSYDNALLFKNLYHSLQQGNHHRYHWWINNFITNFLHKKLIADDIMPGQHQEVLRKIQSTTVKIYKISINTLLEYGLTETEINQYFHID